ncbi:uncharacterized protein PGTG_04655 [Puccinia graminis f. sp. tritici CRL 75-36-700-3]|uniref:Presequence translocated-associated motor subunit PAM17 n=2 Tax=Puccinia graminis f. sp. tritici TaxID=56615 RepID=E3K3P7_PUCGT|nr:uncharacterized protein PGTG_04655 [Puccinia graminis f. sp. tritici CRL 75-36-700-3]EFP78699.1 hypothetical protein PGTG_04655 [Puccinia graminis f. sp. tritici CRL 75-36-700-3]
MSGRLLGLSSRRCPKTLEADPNGRLTWPEYLALRKQQRRYALFATIPITTLGLTLGVNYFATIEAAPTDLIMGIEAPYVYGLATLSCGLLGYLIGPSIGHAFFRLRVSKPTQRAMQDKNAQFYHHIKRHRVDPAQSIVNNPLPDWHGERIGSLKEYRKWLRDQSAYKRKATQHNMLLSSEDLNRGKDLL